MALKECMEVSEKRVKKCMQDNGLASTSTADGAEGEACDADGETHGGIQVSAEDLLAAIKYARITSPPTRN